MLKQEDNFQFTFQMPIDEAKLTDHQKSERQKKYKPKIEVIVEEAIEDTFDVTQYSHMWKKSAKQ